MITKHLEELKQKKENINKEIDEILDCLTEIVEWCGDKENIEELEQFKKDCIRLNFGSMTIDW